MLSTLRQRYRELGPADTLLKALDAGLRRLHRRLGLARYYLMAQPVPERPLLSRGRGSLAIRALAPGDPALAQLPRPRAVIDERLEAGGLCLAALSPGDGRLLGSLWLLFAPCREPEHRCLLRPPAAPPCALDVDVYIAPEARGGLTFVQLWDAANAHLRERGIEWSLSRISAFNPRSLRAHERLGARRTGSLVYLELGTYELLCSTRRPYIAVTRPGGRLPAVTVSPPATPRLAHRAAAPGRRARRSPD